MKNHKGQQKAFDRYVDSELYDDYLEAYDDDDYSYYSNQTKLDELEAKLFPKTSTKPNTNDTKKSSNQNDSIATSKKSSQNPAPVPVAKLNLNLTSQLIRELALIIGPEGKNCYFNLKEIKSLKNSDVLATFKDVYNKFETVPVLFLSLVSKDNSQLVYLWQINKKCPYQKGTEMMVMDSKAQKLDVMPHPSLLVLAKIKPFKDECIVDANLINDSQLLIKSKTINHDRQKVYYIFRLYKVKDFYGTSKVNPYKEETLAGDINSHELHIKYSFNPAGLNTVEPNTLELFLFKRTNIEDLSMHVSDDHPLLDKTRLVDRKALVQTQEDSITSQPWLRDNMFSDFVYDETCRRLFLIDKETGAILRWSNDEIDIGDDPEVRNISSIAKIRNDIFLVSNNLVYSIDPNLPLKPISTGTELITYPILLENIMTQPRKFSEFITFCNEPYAITLNNTIFRSVPVGKLDAHPSDLFSIKDHLKTSRNLSWTTYMMGPSLESAIPILIYICNNYLYIKNLYGILEPTSSFKEEKIIILPSSETSSSSSQNMETNQAKSTEKAHKDHHHHKGNKEIKQSWDWEIIGFSAKKLYLCKKFLNQHGIQLVEMSMDVPIDTLFSEDFVPEFQQIKKEGYYLLPLDGQIHAQMDREEEIVFVSFENEPFYHDEIHRMYNVPLSLKNPHNVENKTQNGLEERKIEDNHKENKNFYKKMEKAKVEISHKKDINKGLDETREALKSLRGDISSKMGEVQKFNQKYLEQEKNPKKEKVKLTDPGKVNKEGVQLYQEIKTEKKKMNKQREKEKTMRKKGDLRG